MGLDARRKGYNIGIRKGEAILGTVLFNDIDRNFSHSIACDILQGRFDTTHGTGIGEAWLLLATGRRGTTSIGWGRGLEQVSTGHQSVSLPQAC
jgi:hypothetical protein